MIGAFTESFLKDLAGGFLVLFMVFFGFPLIGNGVIWLCNVVGKFVWKQFMKFWRRNSYDRI